ncbi:hypothetical protein [Hyphomicrobium sp.]|uniref:hypothetical protein n=1 Tax=Hyphomicrobium sp. TaxID=82 RepID=UPI0025C5FF51|nr:hypothetical protein [Hyphomicrobium sp.]MCC7250825.1 hypothetical protein [Hyphomicrobium sp.]
MTTTTRRIGTSARRSLIPVLALIFCLLGSLLPAGDAKGQTLEVLGTARANNRTQTLSFPIAAQQAHLFAIHVRSGSLPVMLVGVEIEFADGGIARLKLQDILAPGQQSRGIAVDSRRTARRVVVVMQPGLRPGETIVQLLGRVNRRP